MDPSEFEDTVEKSADVIHAGALEDFFQAKPRFCPPDLTETLGDGYRLWYDLQDQLKRFPSYEELERIMNENDDQAVKVTEFKEEYVHRRKKLITLVKKFSTSQIDPLFYGEEDKFRDKSFVSNFATECREVIEQFKKEYEFLSSFNKLIEQSFLSLYKLSLSMPEMRSSIAQSADQVLKQQDLLKKCQEQFVIAQSLLEGQSGSGSAVEVCRSGQEGGLSIGSGADNGKLTTSISIHDIVSTNSSVNRQLETAVQRLQEELEREKSKHTAELLQMKNHFDVEVRNREYVIQSKYEEQNLKQQQQYEALLSNKEERVKLIAQELENNKLKALAFDEKLQLLEVETTKRQQSDEKCQQLMIEVTDQQQLLQNLAREKEKISASHEMEIDHLQGVIQSLRKELESIKERLLHAENELASRPSINLSNFVEKIGLQHHMSLSANNVSHTSMTWREVESLMVDHIRKIETELVAIRIQQQEDEAVIQRLNGQTLELQNKLRTKETELYNVEKDLWQAHDALQQQRQFQHRTNSNLNNWDRHFSKNRCKQQESQISPLISCDNKQGTKIENLSSKGGITYEEMDDLLTTVDESINKSLPEQESSRLEQFPSASSTNILQAVQHQRDRYMKANRELEEEISLLRMKFEKLQEEQNTLRNDNLELYRRVRMLRQSNPLNHYSGSNYGANLSKDVRSRRLPGWNENATKQDEEEGVKLEDTSMDNIDHRYHVLYEQEMLSPFKIAELEKQQYLSRMSIMDRTIAWIYRNVMQDPWARHAFLIYFMLVHIFALIYVFQVLNPQLIEEVDAHMKAKWSMDAMSQTEHPDV